MAHDRPDIAHVDFPHREIALPSHHVQRIERVDHSRHLILGLYADLPFAIVARVRIRLGGDDYRRIVERMLPEKTFLRRLEFALGFDDEEEIVCGRGHDAKSD